MQALVGVLIGLAAGVLIGRRLERSSWILRANGDTPHHARGRFFYVCEEGQMECDVHCPTCGALCYRPRGEGGKWWCPSLHGCNQEPFEANAPAHLPPASGGKVPPVVRNSGGSDA